MRILVSLSGKEQIVKGSRVAIRQGKDYWLATVTRRSSDGTVSLQFDEGTKDTGVSLRSATHLPDGTKTRKKPLTKEQVQAIVEKGMAAAAKMKPVKPPVRPKAVSPVSVKVVRPVAKKVPPAPKQSKVPAPNPVVTKKVETLSDLREQLRQLEWAERADNKRGILYEERRKGYREQDRAIREKIKKLSPEPKKDANELVYRHQEFDTTPNKQAAAKNKPSLDAIAKFHKVDLGNLFKTDHRDVKVLFLDEMCKAGFKKTQTLVSPKSHVSNVSISVPIDFGIGKEALDDLLDHTCRVMSEVGEKSGLVAKESKGRVVLTTAYGEARFNVYYSPFADLKHGLLSIDLF